MPSTSTRQFVEAHRGAIAAIMERFRADAERYRRSGVSNRIVTLGLMGAALKVAEAELGEAGLVEWLQRMVRSDLAERRQPINGGHDA